MGQLVTGRTHGRGKAVSDPQAGSLGSLQECEGQPGSGWRRRTIDRRLRGQPVGQPLQALESNVLRELLPPAGAARRHSESKWWHQAVGAFQRSPTALLRKSLADIWSRSWSRCFIRTPLAIGPANLRLMPWRKPASAAGATTGCSV